MKPGSITPSSRWFALASTVFLAMAIVLVIGSTSASAAGIVFYPNGALYYQGSPQTFTVPASVNKIVIDALGAQGGGSYGDGGGLGAEAVAGFTFPAAGQPGATAARQLQVNVGDRGAYLDDEDPVGYGGWNGGGYARVPSGPFLYGDGYGGGGASDIRNDGFGLDNRMLVAGGGGGGYPGCEGGYGGAPNGGDGCGIAQSGTGGTVNRGGDGGVGSRHGGAGSAGQGGYAGGATIDDDVGEAADYAASAGGGGYYGGGGGALDVTSSNMYYGAGGGGSSYTPDGTGMTANVNEGGGSVAIFYASIDDLAPSAPKVAVGQEMSVKANNPMLGPTGQMTATLYGPGDPDCSATPIVPASAMSGPDDDDDYRSVAFAPTEPGLYRWIVSYSGDSNYDAVTSSCQAGGNVVQVVPRSPSGLTASPASPSNDDTPKISGTADAGSTVSLFTTSDCSGDPVATESAATFASPGIAVNVTENSTTTFHATANDDGESLCSTDSLIYVEDSIAPEAQITSQPSTPTNSRSAAFTYASTETGSTFECELDSAGFASCPAAGIEYSDLLDGSHTFSVRATDPAGNVSPVESMTWSIDTAAPQVTLSSTPGVLTNSTAAAFAYSSDKSASTFECGLDQQALQSCPSTNVGFSGLGSGSHTFRIQATDPLGNVGPVVTFDWTIDLTPPQTTILTQPPANSGSATAAFTYSSTEPGSTFECSTDSGSFVPCRGTGVTYSGIADGVHTFSVRATDPAGNTGSAATYGWTIDTAGPPTPRPARIGRVTVTGPARVTKGRRATYRVKIANPGGARAQGVMIRVAGKGAKASKAAGQIAAGASKTVRIKLKPGRAGRIKLSFKVTSGNAGGKTASKVITVKKPRR